jgi:hypothetical protein
MYPLRTCGFGLAGHAFMGLVHMIVPSATGFGGHGLGDHRRHKRLVEGLPRCRELLRLQPGAVATN